LYERSTWIKYGSLDGTEALLIRFASKLYSGSDVCVAVVANSRDRNEQMNHALTAMVTGVLRTVNKWPPHDFDLFDAHRA
jgi:hypothetical protein